jgi:hypothetical protein
MLGFRFLLCKKSDILLISEPLPNLDAKSWDLQMGVECDKKSRKQLTVVLETDERLADFWNAHLFLMKPCY